MWAWLLGSKMAIGALAALGITTGVALGYVGGKVAGHFNCNERIELATERARSASLQRDLEIARGVIKSDKELAEKLDKELQDAKKQIDEFEDTSECGISKRDAERLRNIR